MGLLSGKKALIVGVASKHSIAYGIAEAFAKQGAELAFTYQNEKLKSRVEKFAEGWGSSLIFPCDVASDDEIEAVFTELGKHWDDIDIIVHSVGYAPANELDGNYVDVTTREGFRIAHDIHRNLKANFEDTLLETACGLHNLPVDFPIEAWLKATCTPEPKRKNSTTVHTLICDKVSFAIRISSFQY